MGLIMDLIIWQIEVNVTKERLILANFLADWELHIIISQATNCMHTETDICEKALTYHCRVQPTRYQRYKDVNS